MAEISWTDYKSIADSYASARDKITTAADDLFDAVYTIVLLDEIEPSVDLLSTFYSVYNYYNDQNISAGQMTSAVRAINSHVIQRSGEANLNAWLATKTPASTDALDPTWQDLSAEAGYTVDDAYVV